MHWICYSEFALHKCPCTFSFRWHAQSFTDVFAAGVQHINDKHGFLCKIADDLNDFRFLNVQNQLFLWMQAMRCHQSQTFACKHHLFSRFIFICAQVDTFSFDSARPLVTCVFEINYILTLKICNWNTDKAKQLNYFFHGMTHFNRIHYQREEILATINP